MFLYEIFVRLKMAEKRWVYLIILMQLFVCSVPLLHMFRYLDAIK
jgi:hypothetical protein